MSKPAPAKSASQAPAAWAQLLFACSLLFVGVAVWLLATL